LSWDVLSGSTFHTLRGTLRQNLQNRVMSPRDHRINRASRLAAVNYLDCRKFGSMLAWANVVRRRIKSSCKVECSYVYIYKRKTWRCKIFVNINCGFFARSLAITLFVVTNYGIVFFPSQNDKRKSSTAEWIIA